MKRLALIAAILSAFCGSLFATTRYTAPAGLATSGACTTNVITTAACTFGYAQSLLVADDILFLNDGTYTGPNGMLQPAAGKSGTSGHPITVQAINEGNVIIDGQYSYPAFYFNGNSWWIIQGIDFTSSPNPQDVVTIFNNSNNNIVRHSIAWNADPAQNTQVWDIYCSSNNLLEDVAGFGTGRKMFQIYGLCGGMGAQNNTIRRAFAEWNYSSASLAAGFPTESISFNYAAYGSTCENCIATRDEKTTPQDVWGALSVDRMYTLQPAVTVDIQMLGSAAVLLSSQTGAGQQNGFCYGGSDMDTVLWKDTVCYVAPGTHNNIATMNFPVWGNTQTCAENPGETWPDCTLPNTAPNGIRDLTNISVISTTTVPSNNCLTGPQECWTATNYKTGTSVNAVYGSQSLWNNDGTHGATICKQIVNRSVTGTGLFPWPMNQRIIDRMGQVKVGPIGSQTISLTPFDVDANMQSVFGTFDPACVRGSGTVTTYYTTKSGSDTNDCKSLVTACLTIAHGISLMIGGDTLMVGDGNYNERIDNTLPSGTFGANTTVQAINANAAVMQPTTTSGSFVSVVTIDTKQYISILGIDADAVSIEQPYFVTGTSNNITIGNGRAHDGTGAFGSGIEFHDSVTNSLAHDMEVFGNGAASSAHGIWLRGASNVARNNTIYGNQGYGVYATGDTSTAYDNMIHSEVVSGCMAAIGNNALLYNNVCYSNNDTSVVTGNSNQIYNNTFYSNGTSYCLSITSGSANKAQNNICYMNAVNSINDAGTGSTVTPTLTTDPSFVDASMSNFALQAGSSAIAAATQLNSVFTTDILGVTRGGTWDIGAYQFASAGFPPLSESFSYTVGANLSGQNGGTSWTDAWAHPGTGDMVIANNPGGCGSGSILQSQSVTGTATYTRDFNPRGSGILSWYFRSSITNPTDVIGAFLTSGGNGAMAIEEYPSGNLAIVEQTFSLPVLTTVVPNTCYFLETQVDQAGHPNQFRARVNGAAWSAWYTVLTGTFTPFDGFGFEDLATNAHTVYFDEINGSDSSAANGQPGFLLMGVGR